MRVLLMFVLVAAVQGADPKPCCMSHQFTGVMIQVGAIKPKTSDPTILDNVFTMDYDYDQKKIMLTGTSRPNNVSLSIYDDFANGKRFTVFDNGQCSVATVPVDSMPPPCVPGNFTLEDTYTLGAGSNSVAVNSWSGSYGGTQMRFTMTDDCNPITYTQYGATPDGNSDFVYSYTFANMTQGQLSKASPFIEPQNCVQMPVVG